MPPCLEPRKGPMIREIITEHVAAIEDALRSFDRDAIDGSLISFLEELDIKFCELRAYSRTIRNLTSVDRALPDDVLYMVLEQACVVPPETCPPWQFPSFTYGLSTFSSDTARALSSVCRRWRQLLSNPVVWSDVNLFARSADSLHWIESCLGRSAHMESMVRIEQSTKLRYDEKGINVPTVISRHRSKIRGLYLKTRAASDHDFVNIEMANLERLHLTDDSGAGDAPLTTFSLVNFPGLRVLTLERARSFPAEELTHITDLTLDSCAFPIDLSALLAIAPIEKLRLQKVTFTHANVASVPNLKLLVIRNSPVLQILTALPALPTAAEVYIYDEWATLARPRLEMLPMPYSIFGHGNVVRTVAASIQPRIVSFVLRTSDGGRTEIITEAAPGITEHSAQAFFKALLVDLPTRSVLLDASSMEINVHPAATRFLCDITISHLLSVVPWVTQLFLRGPTVFHYVCNVLSSDGALLPGLTCLNVNLYSNDPFLEGLPLLSDVVAKRPTMRRIAFSGTERQTRSILEEGGLLAKQLQGQGIRVFLLTSWPLSMQI